MGNKYFTVSFDDGLEQDREIIRLMEEYGIKGTFNISSGLFGRKTYIKRTGDIGLDAKEGADPSNPRIINHFILPKDEALALYSHPNVEVASHGVHHVNQSKFTLEQAEEEILTDIETLSDMFGYRVRVHAFPYGSYNDNVLTVLKEAGIRCARKALMMKKPRDFSFNPNDLLLTPTCWALDSFTEQLLTDFIVAPENEDTQVFYMWGHGYEFDYGTKRGNFKHLENLFRMVAAADDVTFVKNSELYTL